MNISKEIKELIVKLYISGNSLRKISQVTLVSIRVIKKVLHNYQVPLREVYRNNCDIEEAFKLRREGLSTQEIAIQLGVSKKFLINKGISQQPINSNCISIYKKNLLAFSSINTELEAYYLGLIYADGSIGKSNNSIRLELEEKDGYILIPLKDYICSDIKLYYYSRNRQNKILNTHALCFKSKEIKDNLLNQGVFPNKSFAERLHFPLLAKELMSHFIRGYFDGDGSVWFSKRLAVSFTGNFTFIKEIENYLKVNKIISTIAKTVKKQHQSDSHFTFAKKSDVHNFYNFIYSNANYYLTRKKNKFLMYSVNCWDNLKAS